MWYFFDTPKAGTELHWRKRTFVCVGSRDYVRKDGVVSGVIDWESACVVCRKLWRFSTGMRNVTPRSVCPDCLKLPKAERPVVAAVPMKVVKVPGVEEIVAAVAEAPAGLTASPSQRAKNWGPRMLKRYCMGVARYKLHEVAAGLDAAVSSGRVGYGPVGWNKWRRPVVGLVINPVEAAVALFD